MTLIARKTRCPHCGHDPAGDAEFLDALQAQEAQSNVQPKGTATLFPNGLNITKEWLADKLAQGDDADAAAGQSHKRPCDTPPGCNGSNCLGCGEQAQSGRALTPFDAVEHALELSSLHAGSVAMSDRDGATAYRRMLRDHLVEYMYPAPAVQAPAVGAEPEMEMSVAEAHNAKRSEAQQAAPRRLIDDSDFGWTG